ncbi:LOW QUALITY PROTEIN: rhodopsin, G0-coupled-like [Hydra vulgaris]|uniref:LOW QUALITY PROTEIN: rhodopsin, G0-coupled-like n=1 Tax=Hydra vulgaris TaxID=6087 RepID=UPI0032EA63F0
MEEALYTIYILLLIIISTLLNLIICYVIIYKIKTFETTHLFILSISILDMVHAVIGLVSEIYILQNLTVFDKNYICFEASFLTYSISVSNIVYTVIISVIRLIALKWPIYYFNNCKKLRYKMDSLFFCYFYGLLWTLFSLLGWSKYEKDLDGMRCSLDWNLTKYNSFTYLMSTFIFCYILPAIFLFWSLKVVHQTVDYHSSFRENCPNQLIEILEKSYLNVLICSAVAYFFVWTPYSVVSLLSIFQIKFPSFVITFCALFAKLTTVLNALVNCYFNKSFQVHLYKLKIFEYFLKGNKIAHNQNSITGETHA